MARTKGSKNKPKDTNDHAPANHNSKPPLSDDEQRALTLHHKRLYEAADELVEKAKAERTKVANQAKADLGKGALADIKHMIDMGDEAKCKADLERRMRLARWHGLPMGFQVDMFADRQPAEERWATDGKTAGMAGLTCQPPQHLPPSGHGIWIEAWHAGQAILASAFGKRKADMPAAEYLDQVATAPAPFDHTDHGGIPAELDRRVPRDAGTEFIPPERPADPAEAAQ